MFWGAQIDVSPAHLRNQPNKVLSDQAAFPDTPGWGSRDSQPARDIGVQRFISKSSSKCDPPAQNPILSLQGHSGLTTKASLASQFEWLPSVHCSFLCFRKLCQGSEQGSFGTSSKDLRTFVVHFKMCFVGPFFSLCFPPLNVPPRLASPRNWPPAHTHQPGLLGSWTAPVLANQLASPIFLANLAKKVFRKFLRNS